MRAGSMKVGSRLTDPVEGELLVDCEREGGFVGMRVLQLPEHTGAQEHRGTIQMDIPSLLVHP